MQKRRGLLNLEPEYQRGFVWDITASSRLVETILLGLPVPEARNTWNVICRLLCCNFIAQVLHLYELSGWRSEVLYAPDISM